jgi:hypothetical protein
MELQEEFGELITHQELSNKLARRHFYQDHSPEEILKMSEGEKVYLGVELHSYEKKYWNEFDEYGYSRLFIKEE